MDLGYVTVGSAGRRASLAHTAGSRIAKAIFVACLQLAVGIRAADEPGFRYRSAISFRVGHGPRRFRDESIVDDSAHFVCIDRSLLPSVDPPQLSPLSSSHSGSLQPSVRTVDRQQRYL